MKIAATISAFVVAIASAMGALNVQSVAGQTGLLFPFGRQLYEDPLSALDHVGWLVNLFEVVDFRSEVEVKALARMVRI